MNYIDSNVFIYPVVVDERSDRKAFLAKRILIKIADRSIDAATSSLTWDEVSWSIKKILGREIATKEGSKFLEFPNLKVLSVDDKTIGRAQKLVEKYAIRPRDAIHIACCIQNNIRDIISDDADFDAVKEIKRVKLEAYS